MAADCIGADGCSTMCATAKSRVMSSLFNDSVLESSWVFAACNLFAPPRAGDWYVGLPTSETRGR